MKTLETLKVNDMFRFSWDGVMAVGVVTNIGNERFSFDDVWAANGQLVNATTINFNNIDESFKFMEYIFKFKPTSPQEQLKQLKPEYYL